MCMEDVRIGRKVQSQFIPFSVTAAGNEVIPADPHRVSLTISTHPSLTAISQCTFSTDKIPVVDQGLNTCGYGVPIKLHIDRDGEAVTKAWYGISALGTILGAALCGSLGER